jgi:glutamate-ammonia-ligase adenylyltransferase
MARPTRRDIGEDLPPDLFHDRALSQKNLQRITELFILSGSTYDRDSFADALRTWLINTPDPDTALNSLIRFAESSVSKAALFNDLLHYPPLFTLLSALFGYSRYFADILVRDPELFRWLSSAGALERAGTSEYYRAELERIWETFSHPRRLADAFRRFYRREILRIGSRDILGKADLAATTGDISALADSLIDAAVRAAGTEIRSTYGKEPRTPFAVIGLGKLGNSEAGN